MFHYASWTAVVLKTLVGYLVEDISIFGVTLMIDVLMNTYPEDLINFTYLVELPRIQEARQQEPQQGTGWATP
jgi:hypothetical protein